MGLLYGIRIWQYRLFRFVTMHAFDGQTDRRTDRFRQQDRAYAFAVARTEHCQHFNTLSSTFYDSTITYYHLPPSEK